MSIMTTDSHPDDGVLLALIDAEVDDERRAEFDVAIAHVPECDVCRMRMSALEAESDHLREAVAMIPVPMIADAELRRRLSPFKEPAAVSRWRRPWWRAAAAIIVLAGAAAASPVRHWLLRPFEQTHLAPAIAPAPAAQPMSAAVDRSASVSFAPSGAEFTVQFDSVPAGGRLLRAERTSAATISARALSGASADPLVVLPGVLRVRNASESRANYMILLPRAVLRLRVIIAGDTVYDGAPPATVRLDRRR
ncbi:MAG: hypothetical protein ABJE47_17815 [bacterium]